MSKINIAILGVGNCASALLQGIEMYKHSPENVIGLMNYEIGGYKPGDINVVAAFDIDKRKVGKPQKKLYLPNLIVLLCSMKICPTTMLKYIWDIFWMACPNTWPITLMIKDL